MWTTLFWLLCAPELGLWLAARPVSGLPDLTRRVNDISSLMVKCRGLWDFGVPENTKDQGQCRPYS